VQFAGHGTGPDHAALTIGVLISAIEISPMKPAAQSQSVFAALAEQRDPVIRSRDAAEVIGQRGERIAVLIAVGWKGESTTADMEEAYPVIGRP
jgi:hypothetical protein